MCGELNVYLGNLFILLNNDLNEGYLLLRLNLWVVEALHVHRYGQPELFLLLNLAAKPEL